MNKFEPTSSRMGSRPGEASVVAHAAFRKQCSAGKRLSAYITPPYGLRAEGPLMTGGCAGAASGAGIRFWKAGIRGAGDPRRVVGLRTKPPRFANPPPCPKPPRAKPGVDATTQAAATNIAAKTRFMIVTPHFAPLLDVLQLIIPGQRVLIRLALL